MTEKEIHILALKFLKGEATKEEEALLHAWYDQKNSDEEIAITTAHEEMDDVKMRMYHNIQRQIKEKRPFVISRTAVRYAASIALVLTFLGTLFYLTRPAETVHYTQLLKDDVGPGGNNATLRLGDKIEVDLDKVSIGNLAEANGLIVKKDDDGSLTLILSDNVGEEARHQINTLQTPKGGQYKVELPDGTKVWLNASSTMKFPSIFDDVSREIELEGEAYFEVARLEDKKSNNIPFIVNSKNQKIEV